MAIQTVFYDIEGWIRCVEDGESSALVHGCDKATSDPSVHGEMTIRHTVTVSNGDVTDAVYHAPPPNWLPRITEKREEHLNTSLTVTLSGGDYIIPVTDRSLALAPTAARRARASGNTRPFPTSSGIVEFGADDLDLIETALDDHASAVYRRESELKGMVAAGTITETELNSGWPT